MRELIGKIPTKNSSITEVVYLSEMVRCLECQQTMPMGIEIVTVKKSEEPDRLCATSATAAGTALTTRRRRRVRGFVLTSTRKRCGVSTIQSGARSKIPRTEAP
jgi:hypothetical protein